MIKQTYKQTNKHTNKQTNRQTDRQTDEQITLLKKKSRVWNRYRPSVGKTTTRDAQACTTGAKMCNV